MCDCHDEPITLIVPDDYWKGFEATFPKVKTKPKKKGASKAKTKKAK